jgi:hypothetical protein
MENLLDDVLTLLEKGIGDVGRLEHIKSSLENKKNIFTSDREYVQKLVNHHISNEIKKIPKPRTTDISSDSTSEDEELPESVIEEINLEKNNFSNKDETFCSNCGSVVNSVAQFCSKCGTSLNSDAGTSEQSKETHNVETPKKYERGPEWKSESTTLILSIVLGLIGIQGIGHIYVGKLGKGIGILIVSVILFVVGIVTIGFGVGAIFLIIYLIMFFWQIFNSRTLCRQYNDSLEKNGTRPW